MVKEKKEYKGKNGSDSFEQVSGKEEELNSCDKDAGDTDTDQTLKDVKDAKDVTAEFDNLKSQLEEKSKKCDEYLGMLQRITAEFDNYKKRTVREKEALYADAVSDVIKSFLPMLDSVERALDACGDQVGCESKKESLIEGIELIGKQIENVLKDIGVEKIKSVNETFNPELHNAVMHVEDETYGENVVVEEYQKGYLYKERVIRYSMVKVAN